jgi:hypothetical protein
MSETTDQAPTPTPKDVAEATPTERPAEAPEQTIEALRAALAKANAEAKENRIKAKELDGIKQSQMTELEKAQKTAADLQREVEQARAESLRLRIALKHGISDDDAATFLTATDEETLNRQAERLAALAAAQSGAPATPKPDRTQGGSGAPLALNSDGLEQALRSKLGI